MSKEYIDHAKKMEEESFYEHTDKIVKKKLIAKLQWLLEHGHGGGNWRRLLIQSMEDE